MVFFVRSYLGRHGETLQTQVKVNTLATLDRHGAQAILTVGALGGRRRRVCLRCIRFCWRLCVIVIVMMMMTFTHLN